LEGKKRSQVHSRDAQERRGNAGQDWLGREKKKKGKKVLPTKDGGKKERAKVTWRSFSQKGRAGSPQKKEVRSRKRHHDSFPSSGQGNRTIGGCYFFRRVDGRKGEFTPVKAEDAKEKGGAT